MRGSQKAYQGSKLEGAVGQTYLEYNDIKSLQKSALTSKLSIYGEVKLTIWVQANCVNCKMKYELTVASGSASRREACLEAVVPFLQRADEEDKAWMRMLISSRALCPKGGTHP